MRAAFDLLRMAGILTAIGLLGFPIARGMARRSRAEIATWSWAAGLLALSIGEQCLVLLRVQPESWKLWGLLAAGAFALRNRNVSTSAPPAAFPGFAKVAWAFALAAILLFAIEAVSEPMWSWDYVAIWGLKGKTLYLTGAFPARLFDDPRLAFSHPRYPLILPSLFAALSTLQGGWDTQAIALLYPGFELATLLVIWGFLRRRSGAAAAATATVLTAGFFTLYQTFLVGFAEIPLAFSFVLVGTSLLDALDSNPVPSLRPLLLSSLLCCGMKQEGTAFLLLLAAAAVVHSRVRSSWIAAAILALVALLHFAVLRIAHPLAIESDFRWAVFASESARELALRLRVTRVFLLRSILLPALPSILAVATIFGCTRRTFADLLLPPLAVLAGLYALAPVFSTWSDAADMSRSTFLRLTAALVPVLFLALGARIQSAADGFSLRFQAVRPTMN